METAEYKKALIERGLIGAALIAISFMRSKILKDNQGANLSVKGSLKLVASTMASTVLVKYAEKKEWITFGVDKALS